MENLTQVAVPRTSVLIPAFNEEKYLGAVLSRIHECFGGIDYRSYEIVVCDNHSTDRTSDVATAGGARVVVESHNQISRARNAAARSALGEWLIFIDADTLPSAELFAATIARFEGGKICAGGAAVRFDTENIGGAAKAILWIWNTISVGLKLAAGSYIYCYKAAWSDCGGFDETIYAGEEIFFSRRLKRWARQHQKKFEILAHLPVTTSARKMEWFSGLELLWQVAKVMRPGGIKRRAACDLWYVRPSVNPASEPEVR